MDEETKEVEQWRQDCQSQLKGLDHENEIFLRLVILADILGFRHASYGLAYPTTYLEPALSYFANYRHDWEEKFLSRHPKYHGSKASIGKRTNEPPGAHSSWRRADFFREARENNVILQRVDNIPGRGGTTALIGLGGNKGEDTPILRHKTQILTEAIAGAMDNVLIPKNLPQLFIELSGEERRFLLWAMDGKTAGEIGSIMELSPGRLNYLQRILPKQFDKTGSHALVATASFAHRMGLLTLPE